MHGTYSTVRLHTQSTTEKMHLHCERIQITTLPANQKLSTVSGAPVGEDFLDPQLKSTDEYQEGSLIIRNALQTSYCPLDESVFHCFLEIHNILKTGPAKMQD